MFSQSSNPQAVNREVALLVNEYHKKGEYITNFNASSLAGGIYFYELRSSTFKNVKKMMLLR